MSQPSPGPGRDCVPLPVPLGLYVHIPFCVRKCAYCDFNSYSGLGYLHDSYVAALCHEIERCSTLPGRDPVDTIYFGGGTPSLLPPESVLAILNACRGRFELVPQAEVTLEANPGTVEAESLAALFQAGVNRLSLGAQSMNDQELARLGRIHTAGQVREAMRDARQAGFTNTNLDLIYGLPGQRVPGWRRTLKAALELEPDHLSLYCLTLEDHTPLARQILRGAVPQPEPDVAAEMYELARELLRAEGFEHYELSNWARLPDTNAWDDRASQAQRQGSRCRHNLKYWTGQPYIGFGAGAHSFVSGVRTYNLSDPRQYIAAVDGGTTAMEGAVPIDSVEALAEAMILGLRLVEGLRWQDIRSRLGRDPRDKYAPELSELQALGLITLDDTSVRLTARGQLLGNQVFVRFLPDSASRSLA